MPHLCWTIHQLILKFVKKEFKRTTISSLSHLCKEMSSLPLSHNMLRAWFAVCMISCVCCVCRQVSQWTVQTNITLPHWYQPCDPGVNFIAMEITGSDLCPGPLARDPAGNITHTHRQTHTHLSLTSCEKSLYKRCRSLLVLHGHVWPDCAALGLALLQGVAKKCYICKVNRAGQKIWYGRLAMGIYAGSWSLLVGG